jgi:RES domain
MKLTDTLDEQTLLENILDETKPPIPAECEGLHYLLLTPFRYSASNPWGSRFRRANSPKGVFYASDHPNTAIAEIIFHRLLFFAESPKTPWPQNPGEYSAFAAEFHSDRALDLTKPPLLEKASPILQLADYSAGQAFSELARSARVEIIKYPSLRDPSGWPNVALLAPVFGKAEPVNRQSWRIHFDRNGVRAICEAPRLSIAFERDAFNNDPRMANFDWER